MWNDLSYLVSAKKWDDILLYLSRIGITHFINIIPRIFGKRRTLVALWVGDNEVEIFGDQKLMQESPFLKYIINNNKAEYNTPEHNQLFNKAKTQIQYRLGGERIEIFKREIEDLPFSILFFVQSPDILFSRNIGEIPVYKRDGKPIENRDLLYYLEAQIRDIILDSIIYFKKLEEIEELNKQLIDLKISSVANAFMGIEKMAAYEYAYYILSDEKSHSRYSIPDLKNILDLVEEISLMKVENEDSQGGIVFYNGIGLSSDKWKCLIKNFQFENKITVINQRKIRKYLDITDGVNTFLIFEGNNLNGVLSVPRREILNNILYARFVKGGRVLFSYGNNKIFEISQRSYRQTFDKFIWYQLDEILKLFSETGILRTYKSLNFHEYGKRIFDIINSCREKEKGLIFVIGKCEKYIEKENIKNIVRLDPIPIADTQGYKVFSRLLESIPTVDGATFINENLEVIGFSAILPAVTGGIKEDSEHGARHNSALRFTNGKFDIFAIVLSEDGPLSLIFNGKYTNIEELRKIFYKAD